MFDWVNDLWATTGYAVFFGAFLGALFGYAANWWHARRESNDRRAALIHAVHRQLAAIPDARAETLSDAFMTRRTYHVGAVSQLLDGETLNAREDAGLIWVLSYWLTVEAWYNEAVQIANQADITVGLSPDMLEATHRVLDERQNLVLDWRQRVLELLPPDEGSSD